MLWCSVMVMFRFRLQLNTGQGFGSGPADLVASQVESQAGMVQRVFALSTLSGDGVTNTFRTRIPLYTPLYTGGDLLGSNRVTGGNLKIRKPSKSPI